jgi:hypothetical protein
MLSSSAAKWLHRIDLPTLLLWGDKDGLVPRAFGEAYRRLIPGSRLVILSEAGHAPFDEQREAFLAAFRSTLSVSSDAQDRNSKSTGLRPARPGDRLADQREAARAIGIGEDKGGSGQAKFGHIRH